MKSLSPPPATKTAATRRLPLALLALCATSQLSAVAVFNNDVPVSMNGGGTSEAPSTYTINDGNPHVLSGNVFVGNSTTYNQLLIQAGSLSNDNNLRIGSDSTANHNGVAVSGASSSLEVGNAFHIGFSGSWNNLTLSDGAQLTSKSSNIGRSTGSGDNSATVSGVGSLWTSNGALAVGNEGVRSTLTVSAGGRVNVTTGGLNIGLAVGSNDNVVTVSGVNSQLNISGTLHVGSLGSNNRMEILDGARVTNTSAVIGFGASGQPTQGTGNSVLVSGANSVWETTNLTVGERSVATTNNTLTIASGGLVKAAGTFTIGGSAGGYLRLADGYLAVQGDQVAALTGFITSGKVQRDDGAGGWLTETDPSAYSISYFATDANTAPFTGGLYEDLGGYTILTYSSTIPEASSSALLAAGAALGLVLTRRPRRIRA